MFVSVSSPVRIWRAIRHLTDLLLLANWREGKPRSMFLISVTHAGQPSLNYAPAATMRPKTTWYKSHQLTTYGGTLDMYPAAADSYGAVGTVQKSGRQLAIPFSHPFSERLEAFGGPQYQFSKILLVVHQPHLFA